MSFTGRVATTLAFVLLVSTPIAFADENSTPPFQMTFLASDGLFQNSSSDLPAIDFDSRPEPVYLSCGSPPNPFCECCEFCYDNYLDDRAICRNLYVTGSPAYIACIHEALDAYYGCQTYCENTYGGNCDL